MGGEDVLDALEALPVKPGTERPAKPVRITEVVMCAISRSSNLVWSLTRPGSYQDPFEEYKARRDKKLAKKAEYAQNGSQNSIQNGQPGEKDDINWFGTKVGSGTKGFGGGDGGGGVGKYLNAGATKRPAPEQSSRFSDVGIPDDSKKKRRLGFGNFEGW